MREGIYAVTFKGPAGDGHGMIVIQGNTIYGGDNAYWYKGTLAEDGASVRGEAHCEKHSNAASSVFGSANSFDLVLEGNATNSSFSVEGSIANAPNMKITLNAKLVSDLI